jgi:CRISPR-associated protein Cmr5
VAKLGGLDDLISSLGGQSSDPPPKRTQTRAQQDLTRAAEAISALGRQSDGVKENYLSRVKQFPALVMTVGLAQAVAFSVEKASKTSDLGKAHRHLLNHVYAVMHPEAKGEPVNLDTGAGRESVLELLQNASTPDYLHLTRRVLAAWVYYRRFAVSLLDPDGKLAALGGDEA